MATISVSLPSDGETIEVADYNVPITTIVNEINGNLDNTNIAAAAAIAGSKLADSGVSTAKLADAAVTPAKLLAGTGTTWVWQAWTPTLSGRFNDGKWTKSGTYIQIGKAVFAQIELTANAGTPMDGGTAEAIFTLPVTSVSQGTTEVTIIGQAGIVDTGTAFLSGVVQWVSTTTAFVRPQLASGTYTQPASITSSVPFTWVSGDKITINIMYQAA